MQIEKNAKIELLISQLDLQEHINHFTSFFSRPNSLYIEGDQEQHFRYIKALDAIEFNAPPKVGDFTNIKLHLQKKGVLTFEQIFEIIKAVRYFRYFKNLRLEGILFDWMNKIVIEPRFDEIDKFFGNDGTFNESLDETLFGLGARIKEHKSSMIESMKRLFHTQKIVPYLVDTQIHYINDEEALLVRGGFNHVLKGAVIGRSTHGYFYVSPDSLLKAKEQIRYIEQEREAIFYAYAKSFSLKLAELLPFINFIDKEFSRFDNYQARVMFARAKGLQIIKAHKSHTLQIVDFAHPALHNPKPINVDFTKNVLMVTGVNAGGKTMLLKSILSCAFMAKYLIPMRINEHKSHIGNFKNILAIIDDPQNVKNDISTFAGRMVQFAKIHEERDALIGVDEIELGTDSDEAAALFKVMLDELIKRGQKVIVTTHHKRLASLMADRDDVELLAAIYDEEAQKPTYEFMHGIIGKSYAFETAKRYGISHAIVSEAKKVYGDNSERLNLLIERGSQLERELRNKHRLVDEKLEDIERKEQDLKERELQIEQLFEKERAKLRATYDEAINEAKRAAKANDSASIHRAMNKASAMLPQETKKLEVKAPHSFSVGDRVKYLSQKGTIVAIKGKDDATIEVDGMRVRVKTKQLKPSGDVTPKPKVDLQVNVEKKSGLKLDLHGMRGDEACEALDKFLSDALLAGWDEVLVYHGIGTGKLAYAVKNFLKEHPSVKGFSDAPQHMGGFGAKLVSL